MFDTDLDLIERMLGYLERIIDIIIRIFSGLGGSNNTTTTEPAADTTTTPVV